MRKNRICLALIAALIALSGCTKGEKNNQTGGETKNADNVSDANIAQDYGEVTLCDYKKLSADENVYTVSDEDVDMQIETILYDYAQYEAKEGPSEEGDYVAVNMVGNSGGERIFDYEEENYEVILGVAEFGEEFDEKLTGVSAGAHLLFSVTYAADYEDDSLAGLTVDYDVTVVGVTQEILPELTEEFIRENLDYDSKADMVAGVRASLEEEYRVQSRQELRENLIQQVIDQSEFGKYEEELYDACADSLEQEYLSYREMLGCETLEEVYDFFGMTDEDVKDGILNQVYRMVAVQEIGEQEKITLSDEEYEAGLESYAEEMELSAEELVEEYGADTLHTWILEDKILDFLVENAKITKVEATDGEE